MYKNSSRKIKHPNFDLYADLEKIKSAFGDTAHDVKGKVGSLISQSLENARDTTTDMQDNVIEYIQAKPLKSVGLAMMAGVIVGWLLHK